MQISEESLDFATAHYIIACLRNQEELVVYEDPLAEISKACRELKYNLANYFSDPVESCIDPDILEEILRRMVKNEWGDKKELTNSERNKIITKLAKIKIPGSSAKKIKEELNQTTDEFLLRLDSKSPKEKKDLLREWIGGELEKFGEELEFVEQEEESDIVDKLINLYKKHRVAPKLWIETGKKGYPTRKWIQTELFRTIRPGIIHKVIEETGRKLKLSEEEILEYWYDLEKSRLSGE
ncbi:MAG: hypothetical protein ACOCT9_01920 [archaeon]